MQTSPVPLIGRCFLGLYPIIAGFDKIIQWDMYRREMEHVGMPLVPLFLVLAALLLVGGGLSIITGFKARRGAIALIVFPVPASLLFTPISRRKLGL